MTAQKLTPEEIEEAKQNLRSIALKNIGQSNIPNLAVVYNSNREGSGYGKNDNDAVENFLYLPSIKSGSSFYDPQSGKDADLIYSSLVNSRQEGVRYSGQVSEYGILQTAAKIMQDSLLALKVEDILSLVNSSIEIKEDYQDNYISDLIESQGEEGKKLAGYLIGGFMEYITAQGVSKALEEKAGQIKGGLESLVKNQ